MLDCPLSWRLDQWKCILCLRGGYIGVEFFFIVSGYFLMRQIDSGRTEASLNGLRIAVVSRFKKIAPYMLPTFLVLFAMAHLKWQGVSALLADLAKSLYEILLLCMMGTIEACPLYNPPIWYCSALLICVVIIYAVAKNYRDLFIKVLAPIAIVVIYSYLLLWFGDLNTITDKAGVLYTGILRGLAAMCIGACLFDLVGKRDDARPSTGVLMPACASVALLAFVVVASWRSSILDGLSVLALAVLIYIAFTSPRLANAFSSPAFAFLGRLSLPLYINQWIVVKALSSMPGLKAEIGTLKFIALYMALCIGITLLYELIISFIRRLRAQRMA